MGSGQTDIQAINSKLSTDEEEIVDSILSELNESDNSNAMGDRVSPQQQMTQQQMAQQQMAQQKMAQQKMAQQQMGQQQMGQQQMAQQQMGQQQMAQQQMAKKMGMELPIKEELSGMNKIMADIKDPLSVALLTFLFSMPQLDNLLLSNFTLFKNEEILSMSGILFKSLIAGVLFYIIKMYS